MRRTVLKHEGNTLTSKLATALSIIKGKKNMKATKALMVLATLSMLGLNVACNSSGGGNNVSDRYQEGFDAGKAQGYDLGYDDGYADGDDAGYERARVYFTSQASDYNAGFNAGKTAGYNLGKTDGYNLGLSSGYDSGYDDGYDDGRATGGNTTVAYNDGYDDGLADGYDMGYDDGIADGYDLGYDDGYDDGYYALSVGPAKDLKGYANVLAIAHNEVFDYSKMVLPKSTARGLEVNGKLILSETSLTNKDTSKRSAVLEQYLVVEMAKQAQEKMDLSAERSIKLAKASNHFRKFSSARALTNDDTSAYMEEMVGSNLASMSSAMDAFKKGDVSEFNARLEAAAVKNQTSIENATEILTDILL